jgi:hypothetical protein
MGTKANPTWTWPADGLPGSQLRSMCPQ